MLKNLLLVTFCSGLMVGCATQCIVPEPKEDNQNKHVMKELKQGINIYFEKNSSRVESRYDMYFHTAAKTLAQNPSYILELEGHTDSTGSLAANNKVSLNRANAIKNKLVIEYNVNPNQLKTYGAGPAKPIDTNSTPEGRANNRRVSAILKIQ